MTNATKEFARLWRHRYERDPHSAAVVLTWDPFREWGRNAMPESSVESELTNGLEIAYAFGPDYEQAVAFFRRACQVAQRAVDEDKLSSPLCSSSFPLNRGMLYRNYTYAHVILGEPLDIEALRQSSRDFEEWCKNYGKGEWDSQSQAYYLAAVRLSLVAGDLDRAHELLKTKKSFKWHNTEHGLWKMLVEKRGQVRENAEFVALFNYYFAKLRDPSFVPDVYMETDVLRLELAAIADKYITSDDGRIDWPRAVDSIPGP
ncbi:MAG: hypothetical protein M3P06_07135 [Acidobacteriota bacterium]|nr:hypothetical protein [Acidobacteriota bacterium]